jgi:hypothetical protein
MVGSGIDRCCERTTSVGCDSIGSASPVTTSTTARCQSMRESTW